MLVYRRRKLLQLVMMIGLAVYVIIHLLICINFVFTDTVNGQYYSYNNDHYYHHQCLNQTSCNLKDNEEDGRTSSSSSREEEEEETCNLYIAESTIPKGGLGLFTGSNHHPVGERIGDGDICIPLYDFYWHHNEYYEYVIPTTNYYSIRQPTNKTTTTTNDTTNNHSRPPDKIASQEATMEPPFLFLSQQSNPSRRPQRKKIKLINPFQQYTWKASEMGFHSLVNIDKTENDMDIQAYCPGMDAVANCNLALLNVGMSEVVYDDYNYHDATAAATTKTQNDNKDSTTLRDRRFENPTTGAISYWNTNTNSDGGSAGKSTTYATRYIPQGGELFKFYGDNWFVSRQEVFGLIPLSGDYDTAQSLLDKFVTITEAIKKSNSTNKNSSSSSTRMEEEQRLSIEKSERYMSNDKKKNIMISNLDIDFWNLIKNFSYASSDTNTNTSSSSRPTAWQSRVMNALPESVQDAIIAGGGGATSSSYRKQERKIKKQRKKNSNNGVKDSVENNNDNNFKNNNNKNSKDKIHNADGISSLHQPNATRSISWLQQHGKCVDNIYSKQSTLQHANVGRGAFAKRTLSKGSLVSSSPLIHLGLGTHFMEMYRIEIDEVAGSRKIYKNEIVGHQLLLNYCFGHPQSTLLVCPYGPGVNYINHNQTLANVKIVWSKHGTTHHNHSWVTNRTIEDIIREQEQEEPQQQHLHDTNKNSTKTQKNMDHSFPQDEEGLRSKSREKTTTRSSKNGLAIDYIAIRDIQKDEELFLDYGDLFQKAWENHVASWNEYKKIISNGKNNQDDPEYISAERYNKIYSNVPVRTVSEQLLDPYPKNLQMRCHSSVLKKKKASLKRSEHSSDSVDNNNDDDDDESGNQTKTASTTITAKEAASPSLKVFHWEINEYGYSCRVLERYSYSNNNNGIPTPESIESSNNDEEDDNDSAHKLYYYKIGVEYPNVDVWENSAQTGGKKLHNYIELNHIHRSAIAFFNQPYTTDIHLKSAFRHAIGIPDSIFPSQWKNLR